MAFNGSSKHSESIWFRHENKNVNTFGYKPYIKGKFISFVCFVCLFVVSFSFLSFSFPWWSYLLQYLPRAVGFSHEGIFTRAEEEGGRFPQGTNGNNRRKFLIERQKTFLGAAQNVFDHWQIPKIVKIDFMFRKISLLSTLNEILTAKNIDVFPRARKKWV